MLLFLFLIFSKTQAQQVDQTETESHQSIENSCRFTLGLGHTHISKGKVEGDTKWQALPSWTFNFDYWLSHKWAIGLQSDLILESFLIESKEQELIERSYPISIVPTALYKPGKHLTILGGIGAEYTKDHTLTLTRVGLEYGFHLPKNWEIGAALVWDGKWNYYNSWNLAFTISKFCPKK